MLNVDKSSPDLHISPDSLVVLGNCEPKFMDLNETNEIFLFK